MKVLRIVPNMSSNRFEASRDFYLERHFLVVDPNGLLLNVMSAI